MIKNAILLLVSLYVICACEFGSKIDITQSDHNQINYYPFGVHEDDGKYMLDTAAIVEDRNLPFLISEIENGYFSDQKASQIPEVVKSFLEEVDGNDFWIVDKEEPFHSGCITMEGENLPGKSLRYFGLSNNMVILSYYTSGSVGTNHAVIVKFSDHKIVDFWCSNGAYGISDKASFLSFLKEHYPSDSQLDYL